VEINAPNTFWKNDVVTATTCAVVSLTPAVFRENFFDADVYKFLIRSGCCFFCSTGRWKGASKVPSAGKNLDEVTRISLWTFAV